MLVGREKELHLLHDIQNDDSSHFVAVYGRRRVGKTFLIREAFGYRFAFQHAGLSEGGMKEQIYAFTSSLKDAGYEVKKQPQNWLEAFEALKDVIRLSSEKKKIIFIDELSWMDTQKSDLMVALENFWNGFASARKDIVLIVCASATSWMLSKVVHNKGGLYNRLTEQIHLRTFCLRECEAYVKAAGLALNRNQILQYYMIFGGVPYYWGFLKKGLSLSQNIDSILFEKDAPLRDEFKYLYASVFKKPENYVKIIEALGTKKVGMTREEIINKIGDAGIVGMGGAGFPTKVKLSPKEPDKIEYIIANCAECEPYITADYRRMLEYTEDLVSGMKVILSLFPNARGVFAVEDNKKDCIEKLQKAVAGEPRIDVKALMTKYPQGAERQLIYAVTKRAINSTMLPADAGCIVDNVETLIGIHNAVIKGKPLMERVVTVSGDAVEKPGNFMAPFGINHRELVEAAGGLKAEPQKLISGGPMMGFAMVTMDAPVTKTSSSILLFKEDVVAKSLETACINCGRCVEICPSRIIPSRLADFSKRKDEASFVAWNGLECVECGSCSYVCPAKRQLKQAIGSMRKTALANRKKK